MTGIRVGFGQPQAPRNVEQITEAAQDYEYDAGVPMRYWLRTAAALVKEVGLQNHLHGAGLTHATGRYLPERRR